MRVYSVTIGVAAAVVLLHGGGVHAQAAKSLDSCQKVAAKEGAKLVKGRIKAVGNCLQKISKELIKDNDPTADGAAKACAAQLRRIINSEKPNKTLEERARLKISNACDPVANASLAHSSAQVLDLVPQGIQAKTLNAWCDNFNGDGSLDTVGEWIDCVVEAGHCQADQQISVEYPRALEWLDAIRPSIENLGIEPKIVDGLAAVDLLLASLDSTDNGELDINCGPGLETCGDGVANGLDHCDGADLSGATCKTLGFKSGSLACDAACFFDISGCVSGAFPITGQTASYLANDDGAVQAGASFSFQDNGNGTITDNNSGLMWEKKSNDSTINDVDTTYLWTDIQTHVNALNTASFAGYDDWRIPNRNELNTLLNLGADDPAVTAAFDSGCSANCTVLTCSCTDSNPYWSSTTYSGNNSQAWTVHFRHGANVFDPKGVARRVRAVRGGL